MAIVTEDRVRRRTKQRGARISVDQFDRMVDSGSLGPDPRRYELIKGVIVERMGEGPDHAQAFMLLEDLLHRVVPQGYFASMGHPVSVPPDDSQPVPDAMVLKGPIRRFKGRHPVPADAALVIEVSNTSRDVDLGDKALVYAAAGVVEYWVLDLRERGLVVHRDIHIPTAGGVRRYGVVDTKTARQKVWLPLPDWGDASFHVKEVLP